MVARTLVAAQAVVTTLLLVGSAAAQQTDAAELFRQGREALAGKNYSLACPKFEESVRLDPHVGPMISLAQCEEGLNHIARARTYWQQAVDLARSLGDAREAVAKEHLDQIDPRVPRLTLRRPPEAPTAIIVRKDDVEVGAVSFDAPIPVEVGAHTITISAPGFAMNTITVELREGELKEVVLELGGALPPSPVVALDPRLPAETQRPTPRGRTWMRPAVWVTGATGVVAVGMASYFGIRAIQATSDGPADPARNTALAEGNASTGLFIGGGALVAASVALWILAPPSRAKPSVAVIAPRVGTGWFALAWSF